MPAAVAKEESHCVMRSKRTHRYIESLGHLRNGFATPCKESVQKLIQRRSPEEVPLHLTAGGPELCSPVPVHLHP